MRSALIFLVAVLGSSCESSTSAYHPNGIKRFEGATSRFGEQRQGPWTYWYRNGCMRERGSYTDDQRAGEWTQWHGNGQRYSRGERSWNAQLVRSPRVGSWTFWHPDGGKHSEGRYDERGRRQGRWIFWKPGGEEDAHLTGEYRDDERSP